MGQTLGEPITTKETATCANADYKVGSSCMQGWRINMEDSHTHILALPDDSSTAFFGVYDGHGGSRVAHYAGMHLHKRIIKNSHYGQGHIDEAIKRGFLELDEQMIADEETKDEMSGSTAIIAIVRDGVIYCGNVGDSRGVVSVTGKAVPLSYDHKPGNELEAQRIKAAGGWVEFNRVNGNLALSRALGDFVFKKNDSKPPEEQIVTAYPDVLKFEITPDFEFMVLACDGVWDVMSNQEVVDFCRIRLAQGMEPETICEELLDRCLAPDCELSGLGCDNMTVILVCLLQKCSSEEFTAKVSRPAQVETETDKNPVVPNELGGGDVGDSKVNVEVLPSSAEELFSTPSQSPNLLDHQHDTSDDEKPPTEFKVVAEELPPVQEEKSEVSA